MNEQIPVKSRCDSRCEEEKTRQHHDIVNVMKNARQFNATINVMKNARQYNATVNVMKNARQLDATINVMKIRANSIPQ